MKAKDASSPRRAGWTRTELLLVIGCTGLLTGTWLPGLASARIADNGIVCRANLRRLMQAVHMFTQDNHGLMPHPSWGTIGDTSSGPDNWAYATRLGSRWIPTAAGRFNYTNQVPFQEASQLWPYLREGRVYRCPTDDAESRQAGSAKRAWYLARPLKLTSYVMNGAVNSYGQLPTGRTHRITRFEGNATVLWEADESDAFFFNDAAGRPDEGLTRRHGAVQWPASRPPIASDRNGGNWASLDGSVGFVSGKTFETLVEAKPGSAAGLPNRLWCDPADPIRGGRSF